MANRETRQFIVRFKAFPTSYIEYNNTIIRLRVQWPQQGGDDPSLVLDISEKEVPLPCIPPAPIVPMTVHHRPQEQLQQQDSLHSLFAQQHFCPRPTSVSNNPSSSPLTTGRTSCEHSDVSSTTPAALFEIIQPQSQLKSPMSLSTERIQLIANELKSHISPTFETQSVLNPQYLRPQFVRPALPSNMNESSRSISIPSINPVPAMNVTYSAAANVCDPQQSSPTASSLMRPLICHCPEPVSYHQDDCPVRRTSTRSQPANNFAPDNSYPPFANQSSTIRTPHPMQACPNDAYSSSTAINAFQTLSSTPIPGVNPLQVPSLLPDGTTIFSHQSTIITNNSACPRMQLSQHITDNPLHPSVFMFPPLQQMNCQAAPPPRMMLVASPYQIPSVTAPHQNILATKQNLSSVEDRTATQNRNDFQSKVHLVSRLHSPSSMQQGNQPSLVANHPPLPQGSVPRLDAIETSATANTQYISSKDVTENSEQRSPSVPRSRSMVKSPVELELALLRSTSHASVGSDEIDQTITDVAKGEGTIVIDPIPKAAGSQQQRVQSSSLPHVCEQNRPAQATAYFWPLESRQQSSYNTEPPTLGYQHMRTIAPAIIRPPALIQTEMTTPALQQTGEVRRKRGRPKRTSETGAKRVAKSAAKTLRSPKTPFVTSTSMLSNKSVSPSSLPRSTGPGTPVTASNGHANQTTLPNGELQTLDSGCVNTLFHPPQSTDSSEQTIFIERAYSFDFEDGFDSSTPSFTSTPISPPLTGLSLTSTSSGKLSITAPFDLGNIYENYFSGQAPTSQENQVTSSVVTPPEACITPAGHQQCYSQAFSHIDSGPETQTAPSAQVVESKSQAMNEDDGGALPKASSKPAQKVKQPVRHPSKSSASKATCTRCGSKCLADVTQHEFPKQKRLVYECMSCGNTSLRSNVSANERKLRLNKVTEGLSHHVKCQFCHTIFHSHPDYLTHLQNDHLSNKPL